MFFIRVDYEYLSKNPCFCFIQGMGSAGTSAVSGDANGAYNIARKGIVMAEHIRRGYKTYIRDEEWSAWLSGRGCWEEWMRNNEKDLIWKKEN